MKRPAIRIVLAPLKRYQSKVERLKGETVYGMSKDRTIYIDPRAPNPVSTLYHELTHVNHPSWTEEQVEIAEHQWWKKSTWKQKAELLRWLGHAEVKNPKEVIG